MNRDFRVLSFAQQKIVDMAAKEFLGGEVLAKLEKARPHGDDEKPLETVGDILALDLQALDIAPNVLNVIQMFLETKQLMCGPQIVWRRPKRKVLTLAMQQVMACPPNVLIDEGVLDVLEALAQSVGMADLLETVADVMVLDLDLLDGLHSEDREHIETEMGRYGFACGPQYIWDQQRVLTKDMQNLLESHLCEAGISLRIATVLEDHAHVYCLQDVLNLTWDELNKFTLSEKEGGIANFGPKSVEEICNALKKHGFVRAIWVTEEVAQERIEQEFMSRIEKKKPDFL